MAFLKERIKAFKEKHGYGAPPNPFAFSNFTLRRALLTARSMGYRVKVPAAPKKKIKHKKNRVKVVYIYK